MSYKLGLFVLVAHVCTALALPPCVCTRRLQPVCGSDGKTYSNPCTLDCERSKGNTELTVVKEGNCDDDPIVEPVCVCPFNYAPVCGNDGLTYPNECSVECAKSKIRSLDVAYSGECKESNGVPTCVCTHDRKQVCGSDGNTYSNICLLNCATASNPALSVSYNGPCRDSVKVVEQTDPTCACTRNIRMICGTDGNTYYNLCLLNCAKANNPQLNVKHEGACESSIKVVDIPKPSPSCACTRNLQEVCGSDGNTYSNPCMLNCATASNPSLSIQHEGPCDNSVRVVDLPLPDNKPSCTCTRNLEPVCGSDGNTYSNPCLLNCATASNPSLSIQHEGPCDNSVRVVDLPLPDNKPSCTCTRNLEPVCGSDGNTYSNPCMLNCATASNPSLSIQHEGPCDNSVRVVDLPLPDNKPSCTCTRNLEPVCGSDGVTYSNECLLNCAGSHVSLVKHEPCELVNIVN